MLSSILVLIFLINGTIYLARSNYDGSGVHINRIIADVSALGFNAGDIKDAINYLRNDNDSLVYTTVDENTFVTF